MNSSPELRGIARDILMAVQAVNKNLEDIEDRQSLKL